MRELYRSRIGDPRTDDEVRGYWLFVLGVAFGIVGVLSFLTSSPQGGIRMLSIVAVGIGLVLVLVGSIVRLPLESRATTLVSVGAAVAALGIAYFVAVFPEGWSIRNGNTTVIGVYGLGLFLIGAGGVLVPLLNRPDDAAAASMLRRELVELDDVLEDAPADEADLAARVVDLRHALASASDTEAALGDAVASLSADLDDATADEADLAAQLRSLRSSQARFELYEDRSGEHRFRLRHRNGNIVATSGEGYTRRHNAQNGLESVRRNAFGATVLRVESEADLAEEGEPFEPPVEIESQTTFVLFEDNAGEFRWRLRHRNGQTVADGGEGYAEKSKAEDAVDRIKLNAPGAAVVEDGENAGGEESEN